MTVFKSIVSGVALAGAAALLSAGAMAEGLPSHGSKPFTWTGFYAGVNAGYASGNTDFNSAFSCPGGGCPYTTVDNLGTVGALGSSSSSLDGFTGGVQVGYLSQHGSLVAGIEADFNSLDLGGSASRSALLPDGIGQTSTVTTSFSTDWLLTLRQRVGVTVSPTVLAYVTGGLAVAQVKVANSYTDDLGLLQPGLDVGGSSSRTQVKAGWTVGGGVEWALGGNWSLKGEYLYIDLGSVSTKAGVDFLFTGPSSPNSLDTSADLTAHIGRVGVNYRF